MKFKPLSKIALLAVLAGVSLTACTDTDANVVNENLSKDADNFRILRRVIFYNGITDSYMLTIEGYCSIDPADPNNFRVTCKVGKDKSGNDTFIRDTLGRSDNVTYFVEQMDPAGVSASHYRVVFKPSTLIPSFEIR